MTGYRAKQLAERYRVVPSTIWRWAANGFLPAPVKFTGRITVWLADDIKAFEIENFGRTLDS